MSKYNCEYVDFMEFGWVDLHLKNNGFKLNNQKCFVPHHFEPFDNKKIEVTLAYKSALDFVCVKGDCDLDRPSICSS